MSNMPDILNANTLICDLKFLLALAGWMIATVLLTAAIFIVPSLYSARFRKWTGLFAEWDEAESEPEGGNGKD